MGEEGGRRMLENIPEPVRGECVLTHGWINP